jgi:hypothetical protein
MQETIYPTLLELLEVPLFNKIFPENEKRLMHIHVCAGDFLTLAEPYLNEKNLSFLREKAERVVLTKDGESLPCGFPPLGYIEWFEDLYEILCIRESTPSYQM